MKREIVFKVEMNCDKCQTKAMKLVASGDGVSSVKVDREKNQLVVTGESMDPVNLTSILRKKVGHTDIVKMGELKSDD